MGSDDAAVKSESRGSRWNTIWKRRSGEMRDGSEQRRRALLAMDGPMDEQWRDQAKPTVAGRDPPARGKWTPQVVTEWRTEKSHRLTMVGGHLLQKVAATRDPVLFMFMRGNSGGAKTLRSVSLPLRVMAAAV
ncbi:uncharacterized protein ColSpa_01961 [Colletotrichum spaethianum]|uniref:Uncharacterized protein n=1 Tax=Colletotrichum spaethianum TaxID=700344 RepID=A0AA37NWY6_9PEZI|nr:uncharacterized protein ColSpa_01961 [Colletotrichum spaethianum]GKT41780.1 hypothetical protein ColSpa_01961 [Colletotrichum spaethianum]